MTIPPHQRPGESVLFRHGLRVLLPLLDLRSRVVPSLQHFLRLLCRHSPVCAEAMRGLSVCDTEVQSLRLSSLRCVLILQHGLRRIAVRVTPFQQDFAILHRILDVFEHSQRCSRMEVAASLERLDHGCTVGHAGQESEFQLTVIGHDQFIPGRCNEGLSYLILVLFQCRLILQVGLAGGETSSFGVNVQGPMDALLAVSESLENNTMCISEFR
mmetsp:Transcript_1524/g.3261  ORF Transcript_1524/g.3261 Transcript_1524/m.3261 type:complete len:214 (-) Transcript_1524:931-1572(-)